MSMSATFVQVDSDELAGLLSNPDSAEELFHGGGQGPSAYGVLTEKMRQRLRATGPQLFADSLSRLDPGVRRQLEQRLGLTTLDFAAGQGADAILNLMQGRQAGAAPSSHAHTTLSLDKAWHGVHYLLTGRVEPGTDLLSRPVMGGTDLGDDDEGFSGYGPARYFTAAEVAEISGALSRAELEAEMAARFDASRMSELGIYPGWKGSDADWVIDGFRRLRDFYADAANKGHAVVTCLV